MAAHLPVMVEMLLPFLPLLASLKPRDQFSLYLQGHVTTCDLCWVTWCLRKKRGIYSKLVQCVVLLCKEVLSD